MKNKTRAKETIRVMKWIAENEKGVQKFFGVNDFYKGQDIIEAIEELESRSLEYLIPIFLTTVRFCGVMDTVLWRVQLEQMAKISGETEVEELIVSIKRKIREETAKLSQNDTSEPQAYS